MNKIYLRKSLATVTRIIDGDTIDIQIDIDLGFHSYATLRPRVRFNRINAPEVRGKERAAGLLAKKWLEKMLFDDEGNSRILTIQTHKDDSFGRWIAEIWMNTDSGVAVNLSDKMVVAGHAVYKDY